MKGKIVGGILLLALIIYGFFIPVSTGLTDKSLRPEEDVLLPEESSAPSEEESAPEEEEDTESETPDMDVEDLSGDQQQAYDWAAQRAHPNDVLLTQEQIHNWNAALLQSCDSVADILNPPTVLQTDTVLTYLTENAMPELPRYNRGVQVTEEEVEQILANRNMEGEIAPLSLGIVTGRLSLRRFPTDTAFNPSPDERGQDALQICSLYCGMPVWILHTSTDQQWYYVQSYYARGWASANSIAVAEDEASWRTFASPDNPLVITGADVSASNLRMDMGCAFPYLRESADSFFFQLPVRDENGFLTSAESSVPMGDANLGYLDYSWTNFYSQACKYIGFRYGQGDISLGIDEESLPGYIFRSFGFMLPRDVLLQSARTGSPIDLTTLSETDTATVMSTIEYPSLIYTNQNHVLLYLGESDGLYHALGQAPDSDTIGLVDLENNGSITSVNAFR